MRRGGASDGDDPPSPPPRRNRIALPDEALWHAVARTVEPLARKGRIATRGSSLDMAARPFDGAVGHLDPSAPPRPVPADGKPNARPAEPPARPRPSRPTPPPLAEFERRKARRIAAGSVEIEARLDLHGLRQSDAHHRLVGFVRDCAANGLATVLVITGKGGRREHMLHAPFDDLDARDHGVLRRSVPLWLAEPELRALIVSYTTAGPRHGGSGAIYIHLRRRLRSHR